MLSHRDVIGKIDDHLSGKISGQELATWAQVRYHELISENLLLRFDLDVLLNSLVWLITLSEKDERISISQEELLDIRRQLAGENIYIATRYIQNVSQEYGELFPKEHMENIREMMGSLRKVASNFFSGKLYSAENEEERDKLETLRESLLLNTYNELLLNEMVDIVDKIISEKSGVMSVDVGGNAEFFVVDEIERLRKLMECLDGKRYFRVTVYAKGEHIRNVVLSI